MTDTEILTMLRDGARQWVSAEHPVTPDHLQARSGNRSRWEAMSNLGWCGVTTAESAGGLGMDMLAYCAIAEELGRELVPTPMLSAGLIAPALLSSRPELTERLLGGEAIVSLADQEGAHHGAPVRATATRVQEGWRIQAKKRFVLDAPDADWFIVSAQAEELGFFLVPRELVHVTPLDTVDGRSMGHLIVDATVDEAARLDIDAARFAYVQDLARVGIAAEMIGAAQRAFEITLDYLKTREQFGRLIGSFQALQHRAAQMLVDLELARSCLDHACTLAQDGGPDFPKAASLAKYMSGEVLHQVSIEMVQMHGGIGMTAEHPAGRYLKWARVSEALFGDGAWLARRYADLGGY